MRVGSLLFAALLPPSTLALLACSTNVNVSPVSVPPDVIQPRDAEDVEVFSQYEQPTRPYMKSVVLGVPAEGTVRDRTDELRERAGDAGCDAIVLRPEPGKADCIFYKSQ